LAVSSRTFGYSDNDYWTYPAEVKGGGPDYWWEVAPAEALVEKEMKRIVFYDFGAITTNPIF